MNKRISTAFRTLGLSRLSAAFALCLSTVGLAHPASPSNPTEVSIAAAERFGGFLRERGVIAEIVFRRAEFGMFHASWQTNAFLVRKIDRIEDAEETLVRDEMFGRTPEMDWAYLGKAGGYQEEWRSPGAGPGRLIGKGRALVEEVLMFGLFGCERAEMVWTDDLCVAPGDANNANIVFTCRLQRDALGRAELVRLRKVATHPGTGQQVSIDLGIEYGYGIDNGIDFIPSSFKYGQRFGNKIYPAYEYEILRIRLSDAPLPIDRFRPDRFLVFFGNNPKPQPLPSIGLVHSNDTIHVKDKLGVITPAERKEIQERVNQHNRDEAARRERRGRIWQRVLVACFVLPPLFLYFLKRRQTETQKPTTKE